MPNLYSITADIQKKGTKYMLPGIHENSDLLSVEYKKTTNGNELIEFVFENGQGERLNHTEWQVSPRKPIDQMTEKEQVNHFSRVKGQMTRFNAIATMFISEEEARKIGGTTYEEFCKNYIKALTPFLKTVKLRIKCVYDKRNFTALPSYTKFDWIEPMTIPKDQSRIRILGIDKMEKSVPATVEGADEKLNEIEVAATTQEPQLELAPALSENDLPF